MNNQIVPAANARFWAYINGSWVKLTLAPHESLTWGESHRTEEGWESNEKRWHWNGHTLELEWCNDGSDCDGRLTRSGIELATSCTKNEDGLNVPDYETHRNTQRDYNAEAAGY